MATFKRPVLRRVYTPSEVFTTVNQGGARVSQWVRDERVKLVPTGTPGLVGSICTKMHQGDVIEVKLLKWKPQYDYEYYARKMFPKPEEQEAYIERCKQWLAEHPPKQPKPKPAPLEYDREAWAKFWSNKRSMPKLEERVNAMRKVGFSEEVVNKHIAWDKMMEETADQRQKVIDDIFGVDVPKTKKTSKTAIVIKPVKKKMP